MEAMGYRIRNHQGDGVTDMTCTEGEKTSNSTDNHSIPPIDSNNVSLHFCLSNPHHHS
jgi:hypothetical protein